MRFIPHQNVASSVITVTNTATALFTLIDTAGSVSNSQKYFTSPSLNSTGVGNGVLITPEDGNVRLGYGFVPEATKGTLLSSGTKYFLPNYDLEDVKLIRTSGDVTCSVDIVIAEKDDSYSGVAEAVTLETGSVVIGTVNIKNNAADTVTGISGTYDTIDVSPTDGTTRMKFTANGADNISNTAVNGSHAFAFGMAYDGSAWDMVRGDSANGLLVNLGTNNDVTGTVTANAGTNLNTSALALESGGNLASVKTNTDTIASDTTDLTKALVGVTASPPTIDSYGHIAINLTTGANQVLVASATGKQIWVYGYGFTCGDADGQTVSLQDEDDTAITGIMEFAQYGGISVPCSGNFAMPVFKLATDKDLEVDITGGDVDGWLAYAIITA